MCSLDRSYQDEELSLEGLKVATPAATLAPASEEPQDSSRDLPADESLGTETPTEGGDAFDFEARAQPGKRQRAGKAAERELPNQIAAACQPMSSVMWGNHGHCEGFRFSRRSDKEQQTTEAQLPRIESTAPSPSADSAPGVARLWRQRILVRR